MRNINRVIKTLIVYDFVILSGWGLLAPIFAIFIIENIRGGNVEVVGIVAAVYWITKSLFQIPVGLYLDKHKGEKDDFYFLLFGSLIVAFSAFGFLWAKLVWHLYALQIIHALGFAMAIPSWAAIFTRHIDKDREAFSWGMDSTALGLGAGISGAVGGFLAAVFGFQIIFVLVGLISLAGAVLPLVIYKEIFPKKDHGIPFSHSRETDLGKR